MGCHIKKCFEVCNLSPNWIVLRKMWGVRNARLSNTDADVDVDDADYDADEDADEDELVVGRVGWS